MSGERARTWGPGQVAPPCSEGRRLSSGTHGSRPGTPGFRVELGERGLEPLWPSVHLRRSVGVTRPRDSALLLPAGTERGCVGGSLAPKACSGWGAGAQTPSAGGGGGGGARLPLLGPLLGQLPLRPVFFLSTVSKYLFSRVTGGVGAAALRSVKPPSLHVNSCTINFFASPFARHLLRCARLLPLGLPRGPGWVK